MNASSGVCLPQRTRSHADEQFQPQVTGAAALGAQDTALPGSSVPEFWIPYSLGQGHLFASQVLLALVHKTSLSSHIHSAAPTGHATCRPPAPSHAGSCCPRSLCSTHKPLLFGSSRTVQCLLLAPSPCRSGDSSTRHSVDSPPEGLQGRDLLGRHTGREGRWPFLQRRACL